jgi:Cdc6-like AAA superfamily ATPase
MINIDESKSNFEDYKEKITDFIKDDLNESDTRSKLIDALLIYVLGWTEVDIKREGKLDSGYFDYQISAPGINFIIEAKRNFKEFTIPTKHKKAKLKTICSENEEIIKQIRGYSIDIGIQYGLMTNGHQFILTKLFNTDGKNWLENECLLFNGIEDIEKRFVEFYDNFSKFAVVNNGGFIYDFPVKKFESNTIVSTLIDRDKELVRNSLSIKLTPIIDRIFGEIFSDDNEDDIDFIEKCFVENSETKKNRDEIDRLFADRAPQLGNIVKAVNTESVKSQIAEEINQDQVSIKNLIPPKPIIIVGSKGAGKTTFINHLLKTGNNDALKDHLVVYIDLRAFFDSYNSFDPTHIAKEIIQNTLETYPDLELHSFKVLNRIYLKQIRENDESIWLYDKNNKEDVYQGKLATYLEKQKNEYLKHLEYLNKYLIKERRKRIIVVIDNADQYSPEIQEKVFLFSHSLSKSSFCGSIISLREGYYYKWRNSPPFDAYESNVYHITAPKYSEVLLRRIDFTLQTLEFDGVSRGENEKGYRIELPNQAVIEFMSGLKDSLFSEYNADLIDYLNYTTYPNIREGLRVFKQFLISGHTNVSDYIIRERYKSTDRKNPQIIPIFEFVKSIGLHNKLYYNSEFSLVHNLFIPPIESNDHFINFYVLKDLYDVFESKGSANKYILSNSLINNFVAIGYQTRIVVSSITLLLKYNLIDTDEQLSDVEWDVLPKNLNLGITSKGYYYFKELSTRFHYIDLCLQDTPIFDKEKFEKLKSDFPLSDSSGKRTLTGRRDSVMDFIDYLKQQENKQANNMKTIYGEITTHICNGLAADLKKIEKRTD